jgi:hypothetical protein
LTCDRGHRIWADGSHLDTPDPDEITGPPVVQPDLGIAAALPGPPPGEPTAAELGRAFMGGLEDHMARQAPAMWTDMYAEYATLRFREFMAQWFGAR